MTQNPVDGSEVQIEKLLLRAMCQPGMNNGAWAIAGEALRSYQWREPVHEALFSALRDVRARKPALLRELLPAALTRRGFPDVQWEEFFAPVNLPDEEVRNLVEQLLSRSHA